MPNYVAARSMLQLLLNEEAAATDAARQAEVDWINNVPDRVLTLNETYRKQMEKRLKDRGDLIYVRTTNPHFVNRGMHQAVLDVGDGLVAKFSIGRTSAQDFIAKQFPDHLVFSSKPCQYMRETTDNLREMGFNIPKIFFCYVHWTLAGQSIKISSDVSHNGYVKKIPREMPYPNAYLLPDLREGGRFAVLDYDEETARNLPNGDTIRSQFQEWYAKLMGRVVLSPAGISEGKEGKIPPYLIRKPYRTDYTLDTAIRKMFLLQVPVNAGEYGRLVLGDFDHVLLFKP